MMRFYVRPLSVYLLVAVGLGLPLTAAAQPSNVMAEAALQAQVKALPASPGDLFQTEAITSDIARVQAVEPRVKRSRRVKVDAVYLRDMIGTDALRVGSDGKLKGDIRQNILNLFDDTTVRLVKLKQRRDELGNMVVTSGIVDDPAGTALIIIKDDDLTAHIVTQGRTINIAPTGDGQHTIREMQPRSAENESGSNDASGHETDAIRPPIDPADLSPVPVTATPSRSQDETPERAQATTNLRVLIVYTPKSLNRISNISSTASLAMSHLNTTLTNSQIDVQAVLAGLEQVNYTEGTSANQILDDATNGVGDFARIRDIRAATQADLVAVIADYGNASCGVAWINDTLDRISNLRNYVKYGTSLINATGGCLPSTFTHEIGHNIGANHDRYVIDNDQPGPTAYNFGYVDTVGRFMDVMAYSNQCRDAGVSCTEILVYSNPDVTQGGRPLGVPIAQATAAHAAQRVREIAPRVAQFRTYLTTSTSPTLSVLLNGSGTVTSAPAGINCGSTCTVSFAQGTALTLTAVPARGWQFSGWTGACAGRVTCTVALNSSTSVTAVFERGYRYSWVYSSAQPDMQSFLRFTNTGTTNGAVSVALSDQATGEQIGAWNMGGIPPRAELQIPISTIELGLYPGVAKPAYYSASVRSQMSGYTQHVLYRPANGTLANLTTCDAGTGVNMPFLSAVHSTLLNAAFPSTVSVTNGGSSTASAQLGIYHAGNGVRLGTYTTSSIPAGGQVVLSMPVIEAGSGVRPGTDIYHYVIRIENTFTGGLQHFVTSTQTGAVVDMTTVCAFGVTAPPASSSTTRRTGPIFASATTAPQSLFRFFNTGTTAGTVTIGLNNFNTGQRLATWTTPVIPPGVAVQYGVGIPESAIPAGTTRPTYYSTAIQTQITGSMQHVLYRSDRGILTNASTCDAGVQTSTTGLAAVHSTLMDFGYPSYVLVSNASTTPGTANLALFDANNSSRLGVYTTPTIPALGQIIVPVYAMENALGFSPGAYNIYHYAVRIEGTFNGHLQHIIPNNLAGMMVDMTASCTLPVRIN